MLSSQAAPTTMFRQLKLLPPKALMATGPVDHADWNFKPLLGNVIRLRYQMLQKLMKNRQFGSLLEVGYGSGIFMPFLAQRCDYLHGIDIHEHGTAVTKTLSEYGVTANLITGSGTDLPYDDASFDAVLAVSALEFIDDLPRACNEINRILRPGGLLFVVTPGQSKVVDLGLTILTGEKARDDFGDRRSRIIPTLLSNFELVHRLDSPRLIQRVIRLYSSFELRRKAR